MISLCACNSSGLKSVIEESSALIEAGDYQAAIDALEASGPEGQINSLLNEARQKLAQQEAEAAEKEAEELYAPYYGTWIDTRSSESVTFEENNRCSTGDYLYRYYIENGEVVIDNGYLVVLSVKEHDGVKHLTDKTHDLVPEAAFADLAPKQIEITMDNWEQYFTLEESMSKIFNAAGELTDVSFYRMLVLKDEYADRIIFDQSSVAFGGKFTSSEHKFTLDPVTHEYSIGERINSWNSYVSEQSASLLDCRSWTNDALYEYDYSGLVVAPIYIGTISNDFSLPFCSYGDDFELTAASGILVISQ